MTGKYIRRKLLKGKKWILKLPYRIRRSYILKRVKSRDFTIISNNCWAGKVYQYFEMPYLSPTIGLYFFASDYLKFVSDLHYYLSCELTFISVKESRYAEELIERNQDKVPIGVLNDIEIIFLHYTTEQEAKEKWYRRIERINWDNVFIKFSRMNLCTDDHIKKFSELPFRNKFVFNIKKSIQYNDEYYWTGPQNDIEIVLDTKPFPGNIFISSLLRKKEEKYPYNGLKCK